MRYVWYIYETKSHLKSRDKTAISYKLRKTVTYRQIKKPHGMSYILALQKCWDFDIVRSLLIHDQNIWDTSPQCEGSFSFRMPLASLRFPWGFSLKQAQSAHIQLPTSYDLSPRLVKWSRTNCRKLIHVIIPRSRVQIKNRTMETQEILSILAWWPTRIEDMTSEIFNLRDFPNELGIIRCAYIDCCPGEGDGRVALVDIDGVDGVTIDFADIEISCQTRYTVRNKWTRVLRKRSY